MPIVSSHRNSLSTSTVKNAGKIMLLTIYMRGVFVLLDDLRWDFMREFIFFLDFDVKTSKQISTTTTKSMNTVE